MRWLALLCSVVVAGAADARMFRCTDGFVPAYGRVARYGDCDTDGIVNGVCTFRGHNLGEVVTLSLDGHSRSRRRMGKDRFLCTAAGSEGPAASALCAG